VGSVERHKNKVWMMRAISGSSAKMNMQLELQFEAMGIDKTKVTCTTFFHAPYPLIGRLIDWFYVRPGALGLINNALEGMKKIATQGKVPPTGLQFEKRKIDHPGYKILTV
jgi:hypothetical protein